MRSADGNRFVRRGVAAFAGAVVLGLVACTTAGTDHGAASSAADAASAATVSPPAGLVARGIPPVPAALVQEAARYTDFRGHRFVAWHPLQREMLVSWRGHGAATPQLWRLSGPMAAPEPLTDGDDPVTVASYEPLQGRYVVFERSVGTTDAKQLFRIDLADHSTTQLTEPGQRHDMQRWLHRSSRLLVCSTPLDAAATGGSPAVPRKALAQTLSLLDPMKPAERRALAELPGSGWDVGAVSSDDRTALLNRTLSATESQVWSMSLANGRMTQVLPAASASASASASGSGPAKAVDPPSTWRATGYSRDNASIWITSDQAGEFNELQRYAVSTRRRTPVTRSIAWNIDQVTQSSDGRLLAVRVDVDGRGEMRLIDARTLKEMTAQTLPDGNVDEVHFHRKLPELELSVSSAQGPGQIFSFNPVSRELEQWTRASSASGIDPTTFGEQRVVRWKSFDDRSIPGLMNSPPSRHAGKRPVMILIHDGPAGQATAGFIDRANYLVEELGIALIQPNVRGSTGHGKTYVGLDDGRKREDAVRDIGALLDWIGTQPGLDASRVLVAGAGYGGYVGLAVAAQYADRIVGVIAIGGMSDLGGFIEGSGDRQRELLRHEYGDEREPPTREFLRSISPISSVDRIDKPLFIVTGRDDPRLPAIGSDPFAARLRDRGVPVWTLSAEIDGSRYGRQDNADFQFYATVLFVRDTLLKPQTGSADVTTR